MGGGKDTWVTDAMVLVTEEEAKNEEERDQTPELDTVFAQNL